MMQAEMLDYLRHIRPRVATTTYRRKHWQVRSFGNYLAAHKKAFAEVKQADVEEYLGGLKCSQPFRQAICAVVREFYGFLKLRHPQLCPESNPAAAIHFKPDISRRLFRVPSQAAVEALLARLSDADTGLPLRDKLMAELAYGSALRRTELARLNIEDIDVESGTARVLGKGDKVRMVPLTVKTLQTLRIYLAQRPAARGPLLLSYTGRRISPSGVWSVMRHRVGIRPHAMRHACATHMLAGGCNVRLIQELLGHERLDTTYIYTEVDKGSLREVMARTHPRGNACCPAKNFIVSLPANNLS